MVDEPLWQQPVAVLLERGARRVQLRQLAAANLRARAKRAVAVVPRQPPGQLVREPNGQRLRSVA